MTKSELEYFNKWKSQSLNELSKKKKITKKHREEWAKIMKNG